MKTRHSTVATVIGDITVVAAGKAIVGVYFPHHWTRPSRAAFGPQVDATDDGVLDTARTQLRDYLGGERTSFELSTSAAGDQFQRQVWALLAEIPYGETATYGNLAERLGDKGLAQAVGRAVGQNPLSIIVPCHRVVGKGGKLTGYAGGVKRKQFLLELEESALVSAARLF
ncbi:MAG: methylated-DNA--[protein]-cysteine S-methyltransferase [Frankiales bacterium]|nr:methylated-DNA--[protein]-cysteine S-methyltransferase [Frankiales bacterium]